LANGLYLPVAPSKLIEKLPYKIAMNMNDIHKLKVNDTIKLTEELSKNTKIKSTIKFKILDLKLKNSIIALVNEFNRFIPVITEKDNLKKIKIADINYFSDIDESINNKIEEWFRPLRLYLPASTAKLD
jgi:hypothetical protein